MLGLGDFEIVCGRLFVVFLLLRWFHAAGERGSGRKLLMLGLGDFEIFVVFLLLRWFHAAGERGSGCSFFDLE